MNNEEKKKNLEMFLQDGGFDFEFIHPPNIDEPVLLIKDYAPALRKAINILCFYID